MGGLLCGMGAFCYAELGTMWMQNGGDHVYLKHAFGMYASMCFSWTMALLSLPLCNSSIAAVFGEYVAKLALYDPSLPVSEQAIPSAWAVKITSMLIIVFAGFMNASSNRVGTLIQNVCTVAKLAALVLIAILGFISIGKYGAPNLTNVFENRVNPGATIGFVDFGKALLIALFPCSGFQNLNYVTGEVKNPRRTLPMAIAISVCIITCVYLFANIAYFAVLPLEVVATSKVVALELGVKMLGAPGAYIMCIFVALSALGAVNGTIIGNSRLLATAASEGILFPKTFAKLSPRQTPVNGIILSCVVAILLLIPDGGFEFLAPLYSFTNWTFYALTVGALIYLRRKSPNMERPFRVWTPLAYIFVILCVPIIALQCYEKEYSVSWGYIFYIFCLVFKTHFTNRIYLLHINRNSFWPSFPTSPPSCSWLYLPPSFTS